MQFVRRSRRSPKSCRSCACTGAAIGKVQCDFRSKTQSSHHAQEAHMLAKSRVHAQSPWSPRVESMSTVHVQSIHVQSMSVHPPPPIHLSPTRDRTQQHGVVCLCAMIVDQRRCAAACRGGVQYIWSTDQVVCPALRKYLYNRYAANLCIIVQSRTAIHIGFNRQNNAELLLSQEGTQQIRTPLGHNPSVKLEHHMDKCAWIHTF